MQLKLTMNCSTGKEEEGKRKIVNTISDFLIFSMDADKRIRFSLSLKSLSSAKSANGSEQKKRTFDQKEILSLTESANEDPDAQQPKKVRITSITDGKADSPTAAKQALVIPVESLIDKESACSANRRSYNQKSSGSAIKQFGLVLMSSDSAATVSKQLEKKAAARQTTSLLMKSRMKSTVNRELDADIDTRPGETSSDAYKEVPVEEFGAALLRGMGWKEDAEELDGDDINDGKKKFEPVMRPKNLGLGAKVSDEMPPEMHRKQRKPTPRP